MVHGIARLMSAVLAVVEFMIVLLVLFVLGATALPGMVRVRKRVGARPF
jgi:competence protein ComGC